MFKKFFYIFLLTPTMLLVGCNKDARPIPPLEEPLHFTCTSGEVSVGYYYIGEEKYKPNLEWSNDKKKWNKIIIPDEPMYDPAIIITNLTKDQTVYFRGNNPSGLNHDDDASSILSFKFSILKEEVKINLAGNIMSLLSANEFKDKIDIPCSGCFDRLFCGNLFNGNDNSFAIDASNLLLPATELEKYTYLAMFQFANIVKAPKDLPAKIAKIGCYDSMFLGNDSLSTAPIIHLENLENGSCSCMFWQCSSLNVNKDDSGTKFFTCPDIGTLENPVYQMFKDTKTDLEDPQTGEVFYFN